MTRPRQFEFIETLDRISREVLGLRTDVAEIVAQAERAAFERGVASVRSKSGTAESLGKEMLTEARKLQQDTGLGRLAMAEQLAMWAGEVFNLEAE